MISIIIPAYNEANVIVRCLDPLLPGARDNELEIIVVCNGCTDKTAQIVASLEDVKLIETPIPSKTNALNLGDEVASGFPRFYLDADIVMSLESVRKVAEVLRSGKFLAAAPQMKVNYSHSSWFVKAYYDIWQQLPYVKEGMIGTGVYALSEEGRKRFDKFPNIIADDGYVRALFRTDERCSANECFVQVTAPITIRYLLNIKTRSRRGYYELLERFPLLVVNIKGNCGLISKKNIKNIKLYPKYTVYLFVNFLSRIMAKRHLKYYGVLGWERDDSSRKF